MSSESLGVAVRDMPGGIGDRQATGLTAPNFRVQDHARNIVDWPSTLRHRRDRPRKLALIRAFFYSFVSSFLLSNISLTSAATEHPIALVRPRIFDKKSPENEFYYRGRAAHTREEAGQVQQSAA